MQRKQRNASNLEKTSETRIDGYNYGCVTDSDLGDQSKCQIMIKLVSALVDL